jgi:hypothetical protein
VNLKQIPAHQGIEGRSSRKKESYRVLTVREPTCGISYKTAKGVVAKTHRNYWAIINPFKKKTKEILQLSRSEISRYAKEIDNRTLPL